MKKILLRKIEENKLRVISAVSPGTHFFMSKYSDILSSMRNVLVLVTTLTPFVFQQPCYAKELAGEVVSAGGIVFTREDKNDKKLPKSPQSLKPGDNVYSGDVINTSSEGSVKILMRDKSLVDLGASSLFKVDEYQHNKGSDRKAKLDLMFGQVRVAVTKKLEGKGEFKIKTRSATMGVRGTELIIKSQLGKLSNNDKNADAVAQKDKPQPKTEVTVVQGKVEVKSEVMKEKTPVAKTVTLTAGTQLSTGKGVDGKSFVSAPVKLNETQMKSLSLETKIKDNTFAKTITIEAPASGGGEANRGPSSEGSTNNALKTVLVSFTTNTLPTTTVPFSELGVAGTFGVQNIVTTVQNVPNGLKNLHINIITPGGK